MPQCLHSWKHGVKGARRLLTSLIMSCLFDLGWHRGHWKVTNDDSNTLIFGFFTVNLKFILSDALQILFLIASSCLLPLPPSLPHPLTFFMASLGKERNGSWIQTQEKMPLKASMQGSLCALSDSVLLLEICSHHTLVSTGHGVMIAVFSTKQADNHLYVETFA